MEFSLQIIQRHLNIEHGAERAFASSVGKVVTAILRLGDYKMFPPEISQYFVPDFRPSRPYEAALDEL